MKTRLSLAVIAIALSLIAINMTYANFAGQKVEETAKIQAPEPEEILKIVGRATDVFDGIGVESGFVATDGVRLRLVPYDRGSMAATPGWKPQYIKLVKYDGQTIVAPVTVDQFN